MRLPVGVMAPAQAGQPFFKIVFAEHKMMLPVCSCEYARQRSRVLLIFWTTIFIKVSTLGNQKPRVLISKGKTFIMTSSENLPPSGDNVARPSEQSWA